MDFYDLFHEDDSLTFVSGQTIFCTGDKGDCMYVVLDGEVALHVAGKEVYRAGLGEIFGEMALIDEEVRSATAYAVDDAKVAIVNAQRFDLMCQRTPQFARRIMSVLADRLRAMNARELERLLKS